MPISQNTALFSLLGTNYGGDGRVDLRAARPQGSRRCSRARARGCPALTSARPAASSTVTLLQTRDAGHTHLGQAVNAPGDVNSPAGPCSRGHRRAWPDRIYGSPSNLNVAMHPQTLRSAGGSQPHNNMPPYLTLTFIIALQGIFPQRP